MTSSASRSFFPDINVWFAMAHGSHVHHEVARAWFESIGSHDELLFCRFTQLGLLRLTTTAASMDSRAITQRQAWVIYDTFVSDGNARLLDEPRTLEGYFRSLANLNSPSSKDWADSYLAAFAESAGLTLVTFDKALARRSKGAQLLRP